MQNVVLLVLDAFRTDGLENAPTISRLAKENVHFEQAVAPASWSLPSHASLFSGKLPHEHGCLTDADRFVSVPLVDRLNSAGYTTHAVSANPFCSPWYGFSDPFSSFTYTLDLQRHDGLDVYEVTRSLPTVEGIRDVLYRYGNVLRAALTHDSPMRSLQNMGIAGITKIINRVEVFDKIPHPLFQSSNVYLYRPERNTRAINAAFRQEINSGGPFFMFSNFMDTHRPYYPSKKYQHDFLEKTLSFREIEHINEGTAHPQRFIEMDTENTLDEGEIETVRSLYAGTVSEVDDHVERILTELEACGLREDTTIVITADHGEDLGEVGPRGDRRMGHFDSVSDNLFTVPLIIANPSLSSRTVEDPVPLRRVFQLVKDRVPTTSRDIVNIVKKDGPVIAEAPASEGDWADLYPSVPKQVVKRETEHHTVVGYENGYKYAIDSGDGEWTWHLGEPDSPGNCPESLRTTCRDYLAALCDRASVDSGTIEHHNRQSISNQLEDLGYM